MMIREYRQRIICTLDAILRVGDIKTGLKDKEMWNILEKNGYLGLHYEITSKGKEFHRKLHEKQFFGGLEGRRKFEERYIYWAEKMRPLAEASDASQRIDYRDLGLTIGPC